jgi:hypothetical protein
MNIESDEGDLAEVFLPSKLLPDRKPVHMETFARQAKHAVSGSA